MASTSTTFEIPTAAPGVLASDALRDPKVRERMSPVAVKLFLKLSDLWRLAVDQRRSLLGDISKPTYHNWQNGKIGTLTRDQLERISLVLGIHKGLKLLFADESSAARWLTSPNRDLPFGGVSPLDRALRGSIDDLYAVRRYVDAWRGMK
ncbi:MbcA/ParS/Xre antitoxin family protein [Bradyrhizobium yuanmingense]|uniref:MbcA/ParS/Xre antitoxin family protein n=1 Tax=Bradyrhizobium yuanmingense TaxID=108015 RepID=UPI00192B4D5A|nr:MbcA/ParS/Xre antitoxin family protein [Bradyrhizobium yuanmingense]